MCVEVCNMADTISYRLEVPKKTWEKFKAYLRKIYWEEEISVKNGIIRLIEKFIEENQEVQ